MRKGTSLLLHQPCHEPQNQNHAEEGTTLSSVMDVLLRQQITPCNTARKQNYLIVDTIKHATMKLNP